MTDEPFPWWQYIVGGGIFLTVLTFSGLIFLDLIQEPYRSAEQELTQLARETADLVEVDRFFFFNGKESYTSLLGKDSQGHSLAVTRQAGDDKLYVYDLDRGVSQAQAEQLARENGADQIERTTFGRLDGKPVWEIKSGAVYYVVDFETGTISMI